MKRYARTVSNLLWIMCAGFSLAGCTHNSRIHSKLVYTDWQLIEIGGKATAAITEGRHPSLNLSEKTGGAQGSGGCNRYASKFTQSGESLSFSTPLASKVGCASEVNQLEITFFAALRSVATQKIEGDQLELRDDQGKLLMRLQAKAGSAQ
ncbi:MAG: META domain-containing protein [Pseudomonadota bacterium]|nr:META domain-containing protein [Pseudomonadota bacterium]